MRMSTTMRAVQLDGPGPPASLHLRELPLPEPGEGWVRIRVEAFGLNRSELYLRLGLSEGVTFPRVPGIEAVGVVDAVLELVGTPTLRDSLRAVRVHGTVCGTGMVSHQFVVPDFFPQDYLPNGVRLTAYGGEASDLPAPVLQHYLDAIAAEQFTVPVHQVFGLEQIREAHAVTEANEAVGKLVVRVTHPGP
jgi:NADPH:quinone reductase-like Zn-dependent oxidoreductase